MKGPLIGHYCRKEKHIIIDSFYLRMKLEKGLVHVYTGNGKGKTTAAIGQGVRAIGAGLKVYMIQFMKGYPYSEVEAVKKIENFVLKQFGRAEFVNKENPAEIDIRYAQQALNHAEAVIEGNKYDVVILDEINVAMDYKLIDKEKVVSLMKRKPERMELILTGRYAPDEILKNADVITEMTEIKHPYKNGVQCRKGIDY
jgi:cob(I)alamin adenosyltransferase